jgi:hypothetical protein
MEQDEMKKRFVKSLHAMVIGVAFASGLAFASGAQLSQDSVLFLDKGAETLAQRSLPETRIAMKLFGIGGGTIRAVLQGAKAKRRVEASTPPEFIVSVPKSIQPASYVSIVSLEVSDSTAREVDIASQSMTGFSSGLPHDRLVSISAEPLKDQARAKENYVLYRIKAEAPLSSGEYALALNTGETRAVGLAQVQMQSFVDFGVD